MSPYPDSEGFHHNVWIQNHRYSSSIQVGFVVIPGQPCTYASIVSHFPWRFTLQTVPVDPRDLFRGDYVVLSYEISTLDRIHGYGQVDEGDKIYVRLEKQDDVWSAVEVSKSEPDDWYYFIAGDVKSTNDGRLWVEYGIEAYFVPEGEGLEIQRAHDLKVRVSINESGKAIIKNLIVDGETYQLH